MCVSISGRIPVIHAVAYALIQEASLKSQAIKLTLNDRWKPVTSVILFWTILRLGAIFGLMCGDDSGFGIPICTSPKDKSRSRESQVVTLRWWARCGVLNGSPGDSTKHTSYIHNMQNNMLEHRGFTKITLNLYAKLSTMTPRLMFVTCSVGYQEQQRLASQ